MLVNFNEEYNLFVKKHIVDLRFRVKSIKNNYQII